MTDQRTVDLFDKFMDLTRDFIVRHGLQYEDYAAVMQYMIRVSDAGEWPLWLDNFLEATVDTTSYGDGPWTPSAIEGPYYKPGAPLLSERPYTLPMRPNEAGEKMLFKATVRSPGGEPLSQAVVDVWQATSEGLYSFIDVGMPDDYVLRARVPVDEDGGVEFRSIRPAPYEIPKNGPTGHLLNSVLGRHTWRPAHLHFRITAEGYKPLVTQLYFEGDPYLDSDCATGVKPGLIIPLSKTDVDGDSWTCGEFAFVLQPQ
ncbi:catechol 1,2-dioxygenase [Streptomyces sp. CA-106131]|uniref:dioxygenase family protein n=1 Tax=Streptomyces sp. CA-106131 TaxID=3240045 RepID=UPI003D8EBE60